MKSARDLFIAIFIVHNLLSKFASDLDIESRCVLFVATYLKYEDYKICVYDIV